MNKKCFFSILLVLSVTFFKLFSCRRLTPEIAKAESEADQGNVTNNSLINNIYSVSKDLSSSSSSSHSSNSSRSTSSSSNSDIKSTSEEEKQVATNELFAAIKDKKLDVEAQKTKVQQAIAKGAYVNLPDNSGKFPLDYVLSANSNSINKDIIQLLVHAGKLAATFDLLKALKDEKLDLATKRVRVKQAIANGANVNAYDLPYPQYPNIKTFPLNYALCPNSDFAIAEMLYEAGAIINYLCPIVQNDIRNLLFASDEHWTIDPEVWEVYVGYKDGKYIGFKQIEKKNTKSNIK